MGEERMAENRERTVSVIYEDPWFLAVHKPEGMLVHRSPLDRGETRFALQEARNLAGKRLYPLHRLDRPTSGILLFATAGDAAREGTALFRKGGVEKTYFAVVRGWLPDEGLIDHPLPDDLGGLRDRAGETGTERDARTAFRRLAKAELPFAVSQFPTTRYSLAEIRPLTGRRRQIRRHFKHIFHPLIGDTTFGEGRHNRFFREWFGCSRLMLTAVKLSFPHPFTGKRCDIFCPPAESFLSVLRAPGWEEAAPRDPESGLL